MKYNTHCGMVKYPIHYKIVFIFALLVILTWSIPFIVDKLMLYIEEKSRKNMKKTPPIIENFGLDSVGDMGKDMGKIIQDIPNIIKDITSAGGIGKIVKDIIFIFTSLPNLMRNAVPNLMKGINSHVTCAGKELNDGYSNGLSVLGVLLKCTGQSITNFFNGQCTIYYIIDIIFGTIYKIFVELPIFLFKLIFGFDLQFIVDLIFDIVIAPIDGIIYGLSGYHVTRWSDSVINKCYKCTGTINGIELTQSFEDWGKMFKCTNAEIDHASRKIFYSIFPVDNHWSTWFFGKHLDGWDDATI